jgi:excisionase family DNA binding protein
MTPVASSGPVAILDGPSCVRLARFLRVLTPALERAGRLGPLRGALDAIDQAAAAQHELDRQAFAAGATADWLTVAEAASLAGCSEQNIRARLARGTLAGERRGRAWRVAPQRSQRPS